MKREEKLKAFEEVRNMLKEYKTVAVVEMLKMPAAELHKIREMLRGKAKIKMLTKTFLVSSLPYALARYARNAKVPALIFTNDDPFKLFKFLKENRVPTKAKGGEVATEDIVINPMPTSLTPGPAISKLQQIGLKTGVEGGKIVIKEGAVVTKKGEVITPEVAEVLNMLGMEPLKIGLEIVAAYHEGVLYEKNILDIDEEEYKQEVKECVSNMLKLALHTHYVTPETIKIELVNAYIDSLKLCLECGIYEKEFIKELIKKAYLNACSLNSKIGGEA